MTIGNYHTSKLREAEHWVVRVRPAQERHSSHSNSFAQKQHTRSRACWVNAIRLYRLKPWLLDEQSICCMALSDTETSQGALKRKKQGGGSKICTSLASQKHRLS